MDFTDVITSRYSCKSFSARPVEQEKLDAVLAAARLAPTAKNAQEQRIYLVQSAAVLATLDELTPCRYGAPLVAVVAYDKTGAYAYPGGKRDSGAEDASIVATHMLLAAANAGLDSCWVNRFDPEQLAQALHLPANEEVLMLLDLGYAAPAGKPLPNHGLRKPLSETVTVL